MLTVKFEQLALKPGERVLDLGCGEGRHTFAAAHTPGVTAIGLDYDAASLKAANDKRSWETTLAGRASFMRGDAYKLPFANESLDVVICSEVLEHLHEWRDAVREAHRVLKRNGRFAVTVPNGWTEWLCWKLAPGKDGYADQPGGHVRIFKHRELIDGVRAEGFAYERKHYAHALHSPYWWLKTALWKRREDHPLVRAYHSFLVWDMMKAPPLTRGLEAMLNPVMGKSVAFYFRKSA